MNRKNNVSAEVKDIKDSVGSVTKEIAEKSADAVEELKDNFKEVKENVAEHVEEESEKLVETADEIFGVHKELNRKPDVPEDITDGSKKADDNNDIKLMFEDKDNEKKNCFDEECWPYGEEDEWDDGPAGHAILIAAGAAFAIAMLCGIVIGVSRAAKHKA